MTVEREKARPAKSVDVAHLAGVSRSTVSSILNGKDARFPEATRQKVLAAAEELAYQPSLAARSLVSGRSDTIVMLLPNTTFGSNLQDAVDQASAGTSRIGGNVVVRFAGNTPQSTTAAILALRPLAVVDFGVLSDVDRSTLEQQGTIVVPSFRPRGLTIDSADGGIAELQARALLSSGIRPLWFAALADTRLDPYGPARVAALRQFCAANDLPTPRVAAVSLDRNHSRRTVEMIVSSGTPVGVACYNDDVAIALLSGAQQLGIPVPESLSVVGVDNTPIGQLWPQPLTTVDTDLRGLVDMLASDLNSRLQGTEPEDASMASQHFKLVHGKTT